MAYEKFEFNFTLIDQIIYEIITNQFITIPVAKPLTLFKLLQTHRFYKFHFTITFFLLIVKTWLLKKNCLLL